jgi:hypothetical protein
VPPGLSDLVADIGHACGFGVRRPVVVGHLTVAPERLVGRRVVVRLTETEAGRLAAEVLTILSDRRVRREQSGTAT